MTSLYYLGKIREEPQEVGLVHGQPGLRQVCRLGLVQEGGGEAYLGTDLALDWPDQ